MTNKLLKLTLAFAVGVFAIGVAPQAQAAATMYLCLTTAPGDVGGDCSGTAFDFVQVISDGTNAGTTITTNGVTATLGAQVTVGSGHITFNGAVDGWTVNVSTGQTFAPGGGIDLNSVDTWSGTGTGTLDVYFDALGNAGNYTAQIGGTNPAGGTTSYDGCINPNNFNAGLTFCNAGSPDVGRTTFTAQGGFAANYGAITGTAPFGLAEELNLTATQTNKVFSGDYALVPTPEPTSILLLGGALALAGRALRKKYQKSA